MSGTKVYADFHNLDDFNRLRLTCAGTTADLTREGIQLREGLVLTFYMDDADDQGRPDELLAEGVVEFNETERIWVAQVDWSAVRHASEDQPDQHNGATSPTQKPRSKSAGGRGRNQFVSAAGQFYLAYALAIRQINASLTLGNAPSVDVLACSHDGHRSLTFQVKTSRNAYRRNHRRQGEGYLWHLGAGVIGHSSPSFWYALVDLQEREGPQGQNWNPRIFFVPSRWVAEHVQPEWTMHMYFLPEAARQFTEERWGLVQAYLAEDDKAEGWANSRLADLLDKGAA